RMEHRFPLVPCGDLAGTVDALGSGVEGVAIGDSVFGVTGKMVLGEGTLAELATASTSTIAKRPAAVSEVEAAALPLAGVSALMSVEAVAPKPNDLVVIVGASGGIGSYAVQLAAATGARVIGVTSKGKTEYVKGLGAHEVIDRTSGDVIEALKAQHPDGVAAIIDTASDAAGLARLSEAVRKGGTVTSMKGAAAVEELAKRDIKGVNVATQVMRNSVRPSSPPSMHAKQARSRVIRCSTSPPSRTRRHSGLSPETPGHQIAPSASRQIPSPLTSAQTRRFDSVPSLSMSKAESL